MDKIENLSNGKIHIVGHGGIGFKSFVNPLPENSYRSIKKAVESYNADGVEVDVQLSADNELFLYHDDNLNTDTYCDGCLSDWKASELDNCQYLSGDNLNFSKDKLIKLDKILNRFSTRSIKPAIFLDTKISDHCSERSAEIQKFMISAIAEKIQLYGAEEWVHVMSGSMDFLTQLQNINPQIRLWLCIPDFYRGTELAVEQNFYGIISANNEITKEEVAFAHEHNIFVSLYDMKSQEGIVRAIKKWPDYIQTDNILIAQQILIND